MGGSSVPTVYVLGGSTVRVSVIKNHLSIMEKDTDYFLENINPRHFIRQESGELPNATLLAQICHILVTETTPDAAKILCLKCLGNSCLGYKYKQHASENTESDRYCKKMYKEIIEKSLYEHMKSCIYPYDTHFPYEGVIKWSIDYIIQFYDKSTNCLGDKELDILRLSIQFLCNLFTYACPDEMSTDNNVHRYLNCSQLKQVILNCMQSNNKPLASAACIYVHNVVKKLHYDYFTIDVKSLCIQLLKPIKVGFTSAKDILLYILHEPKFIFEDVYTNITISEKLDLLKIIYSEFWECWQSDSNRILTDDQVEFLILTFCKKSDLILKTVDTYMNNVEPTEVIFILNILGLITTNVSQYKIKTETAKYLFTNCKYLLMSLHMMGKKSLNYFTPITNLSKVAPSIQEKKSNVNSTVNDTEISILQNDLQYHPAYGFKAGLIQVVANMMYRNKMCQDLFREIDGIPLLLDCCNIDARNPFILQWTILAIRNLCEGNSINQEIIKNCKKEGVLDNSILEQIGLTLHEDTDGKSIRIVPLCRD